MTPAIPRPNEYRPIFDWHPPRSRKLSLISFIAASAVLHALCFYIFQIIYPPTLALTPPPARVNIITPDSEDGRLLLRWIEAEDPALSSTTQRPPDAAFALPRVDHVPSYLAMQPALKEPAPFQPDLRVPSARPPGPVPQERSAPAATIAITPSTIDFPEEVHSLGTPQLPQLKFTASSNEPPQAAQFRIAIGPRGEVRHAFLQESSGDSALDEEARRYLLQCRFPKGESDLIWTTATFEWGNDIATTERRAP